MSAPGGYVIIHMLLNFLKILIITPGKEGFKSNPEWIF